MNELLRQRPFAKPKGLRIVDVDIHVNDPPQKLAPYCDAPWRLALENAAKGRHGYVDIPGYASGGLRNDPPLPGGHLLRSVDTAEQMREELDQLGIDDGILLPDNLLVTAAVPNIDYATAIMHAYNRWLAAEWTIPGNGLWGAIMAHPQNVEAAVKEIHKYAKNPGMRAIFLPTAGVSPLWGHRKYDPIFQAAEECDLTVILHSVGFVSSQFPHNQEQFENGFGKWVLNHPFSMIANLSSIMHTGVPARFPKLRIAFTEAGIAWVPLMMWRMDRAYHELRRQLPFLSKPPSEYMKHHMWFGTQPFEEPSIPSHYVETIEHYSGEDNTVFCSDWPHHDFDHPSAILKMPMSIEKMRKIMGENAVKLFNLPEFVRQPK